MTIGDGCVVSANSVVTRDLPPTRSQPAFPRASSGGARTTRRPRASRPSRAGEAAAGDRVAAAVKPGPGGSAIDLSVLIVTYRCRDAARECLRSLARSGGLAAEVIVLDNASGDGTVEMIRAEFPAVRLLALDENLGFAAGVNRAAEEAHGEYLLLLNPDTVVHDGALDSLVRFAREHPEHGLVGGRTLDPDGTSTPARAGRSRRSGASCASRPCSRRVPGLAPVRPEAIGGWQRDSVREVGIVTGCLLVVPHALWRELGGFDTRFFMYGEDADLAMRAWARGLRPAITPDAVVTHEIGVSSSSRPDKLVLLFRGKATLLRKHWSPARRELGLALLRLGRRRAGAARRAARRGPRGRPGRASGRRAELARGVRRGGAERRRPPRDRGLPARPRSRSMTRPRRIVRNALKWAFVMNSGRARSGRSSPSCSRRCSARTTSGSSPSPSIYIAFVRMLLEQGIVDGDHPARGPRRRAPRLGVLAEPRLVRCSWPACGA